MTPLPPPEVLGCYFDIGFIPPIAAMHLRWKEAPPRDWLLPNGEILTAPLPRKFGVRVYRQAEDAYAVTMVWDSTYRQWFSLRRAPILASALCPVLGALGTKLEYLLEQSASPSQVA